MSGHDQFLRQVDKLVGSHVLHGSESLCKLLQYLAKHAIEQPGTALKEYQIATEVYGRPADFDPQVDSSIRVQAGRLRAKLAEYYASEGGDDPVIVELPKGTYHLSFHHRVHAEPRMPPGSTHDSAGPVSVRAPRGWVAAVVVLSLMLALSVAAVLGLVKGNKTSQTALANGTEPATPVFQVFWKPFVSQPEDPWVIFSNAAFVGRPETGMRYYNSAEDSRDRIWDHYTGVGEVLAVHQLDQVFGTLHRHLRVKRGSLFSLDDAENNNLIFVGSPSENLTLSDIPSTQEFVFRRLTSGPRKGDLAIVNQHPGSGELQSFVASPSGSPLTEDYAVIGLVPGLNPARSVMILAGTTTFGTQAAAEYVCRQKSLEDLLVRLSGSKTGGLRPFEALLRVKVTRGVPVETELVAVHKR